jgi:hypothetical protein
METASSSGVTDLSFPLSSMPSAQKVFSFFSISAAPYIKCHFRRTKKIRYGDTTIEIGCGTYAEPSGKFRPRPVGRTVKKKEGRDPLFFYFMALSARYNHAKSFTETV